MSVERTLLGVAVLAVAAVPTGCDGGSGGGGGAVTVIDSAGVTITLSADQGTTYVTVDPEPRVSLGGPNAEGPTQFFRIDRVVFVGDELWVADGQSAELRVFDAQGAHVRTLGGRGDGPGEFMLLRLLGVFAGDSVAAADQRTGQLTVYTADGVRARTE